MKEALALRMPRVGVMSVDLIEELLNLPPSSLRSAWIYSHRHPLPGLPDPHNGLGDGHPAHTDGHWCHIQMHDGGQGMVGARMD